MYYDCVFNTHCLASLFTSETYCMPSLEMNDIVGFVSVYSCREIAQTHVIALQQRCAHVR